MTMSRRDVIVCRGIWYVLTLVSLFGLSVSLNLLWPAGGKSSSSSSSRFRRDGAVSVTTFYAVTLLRCLFLTDPPSPCYKEFTTRVESILQSFLSGLALLVLIYLPHRHYHLMQEFELSMSLFTVSLFTGGIGLIQLSDKLRMEVRRALLTLFLGWLFCLIDICLCCSYDADQDMALLIGLCFQDMLCYFYMLYSVDDVHSEDLDTCCAAPVLV